MMKIYFCKLTNKTPQIRPMRLEKTMSTIVENPKLKVDPKMENSKKAIILNKNPIARPFSHPFSLSPFKDTFTPIKIQTILIT